MKKWKSTARRSFEPLRPAAARVSPVRRGLWGALLLLLAWAGAARADVPPLQPKGYTNDYAGVLSAGAVAQADALAAEVERKTGAQMAVVIVKSLDGEAIEDYANTLARRWGIGKKDNRGILLLLAIQERRDRLEVGYGLEPILPDGKVGGILRGLRLYLQQGNYDAAVLTALGEISAVIAQEAGVTLETHALPRPPAAQYHSRGVDLPWWVILLGVGGLVLFILITGMNPLFFLMGGMPGWGGPSGRERDGNWDGGGFSGFGGGDFGGGGASSDW
ncbi:MAG TPA: TPM domain-containing protein [Bryobacterales bacterium]|jgi:uncharacterized protein|nr:TPM domain-containing protein [Bryobacterales bacterium]